MDKREYWHNTTVKLNPITRSRYLKVSRLSWIDKRAITLDTLNSISGDLIEEGDYVIITGKSEKRIFDGVDANKYYFNIKSFTTGVEIYGVYCEKLHEIKD